MGKKNVLLKKRKKKKSPVIKPQGSIAHITILLWFLVCFICALEVDICHIVNSHSTKLYTQHCHHFNLV